MRTILIHLNVEVPESDKRDADEIRWQIAAALEVGSDDDSVRGLNISIPLAEEI
jgi:hypothetical protein